MFRENVPSNSSGPEKRGSLIWVWRKKIRKTYLFLKTQNLSAPSDCDSSDALGGDSHEKGSRGVGLIRLLRSKLDLQGLKCPNKLKH